MVGEVLRLMLGQFCLIAQILFCLRVIYLVFTPHVQITFVIFGGVLARVSSRVIVWEWAVSPSFIHVQITFVIFGGTVQHSKTKSHFASSRACFNFEE